ncbi:MAG: thiaminase II [Azospirillum sp.]|nr:thiaminase II [Azospirillum sp.]
MVATLADGCADDWAAFTDHAFVRGLAAGTLSEGCFRRYLSQDYLFLSHFARAWALVIVKTDDLAVMRQAAATVDALINHEMTLHLAYCRQWGITEAALAVLEEAPENLAYTRFVLERGLSGDLLDLLVALAPCVIGYGTIGARLAADPATRREGNPYRAWIDMYAGAEYQEVCRSVAALIDRVTVDRIGPAFRTVGRWPALQHSFRTATRLEAGFWQLGLAAVE